MTQNPWKLTIGRIVHFHPQETGENPPGIDCQAALVTYVHDREGVNGSANLHAFLAFGGSQFLTSILRDPALTPTQMSWHWPNECPRNKEA